MVVQKLGKRTFWVYIQVIFQWYSWISKPQLILDLKKHIFQKHIFQQDLLFLTSTELKTDKLNRAHMICSWPAHEFHK